MGELATFGASSSKPDLALFTGPGEAAGSDIRFPSAPNSFRLDVQLLPNAEHLDLTLLLTFLSFCPSQTPVWDIFKSAAHTELPHGKDIGARTFFINQNAGEISSPILHEFLVRVS